MQWREIDKITGEKNLSNAVTFLKVSVDTRFVLSEMQKPMVELLKNIDL